MTAVFENARIRFLYPENWTITDDGNTDPPTVTVQSPNSGFWTLVMYSDDHEPDELTNQVVSAMDEEYEALESTPTTLDLGGVVVSGYEMYFSCLDLVVSAKTFALRHNDLTLLILWQGESRDFDELELVFRAITQGMLQSHRDE
ncbi:MAG: hypothetical protein QGG09_07800 [Pirellulaceae bacterium]|jgi:hypothetical protein|nr:hypothetical protein [Pirellulaceae bacterium]HJN07930.1 hypothetical protein [Pirellulaceae bacterium]